MLTFYPENYVELIIIFVCLIASSFFSASETAITSLGVLKARLLLEQDEKTFSKLNLWLEHPGRVLTTILIFNNIVNILASAEATVIASRYFKSQAVGVATGSITLLVLIFGEVVPKSFARAHSEKIAPVSINVIYYLYIIFKPIVIIFSDSANFLIKKFSSDPTAIEPTITEEEIEFLVKEGEKAGVFEDTKKSMISGVFEFDETKVREIMTPRPDIISFEKNSPFDEAIKLSIQTGHSRIPIFEDRIDNIVGIVFAKDLLRHLSQLNGGHPTIGEVMREPLFVPESKPIMEIFKDLKRTKNHMAVVIDEYGGTAGIVTMEDVLEEIVGDIQDEFDSEEAKIVEIDKSTFDVSGSVTISEFVEFFALDDSFESEVEGEVDSIGGWMTQHLGDLPEIGQSIIHQCLSLEVSEISRHRIERLRVIRLDESNEVEEENTVEDRKIEMDTKDLLEEHAIPKYPD